MGCGGVCYSPEKDYSNTGHQPDTAAEESPLFFCVCISGNSVHMDELLLYVCGHTGLGRVTSVSVRRHRQVLWKQVTAVFFTQYKRQMCVCTRTNLHGSVGVCVCWACMLAYANVCRCVFPVLIDMQVNLLQIWRIIFIQAARKYDLPRLTSCEPIVVMRLTAENKTTEICFLTAPGSLVKTIIR